MALSVLDMTLTMIAVFVPVTLTSGVAVGAGGDAVRRSDDRRGVHLSAIVTDNGCKYCGTYSPPH